MLKIDYDGDFTYFLDGDKAVLTVEETEENGTMLVKFTGELRSEAAHYIQDELEIFVNLGKPIVLDFSGAVYVSYSVQSALVSIQREIDQQGKGALLLCRLPGTVRSDFEGTGISEYLEIE